MPATPFDSLIYADLFGDRATAAQFTDEAEVAAWLRVEAALARAQGALGVIPAEAAAALSAGLASLRLDPARLAATTARNGVPIPGLIELAREALGPSTGAGYLHWGATSQDIMDTALALRLAAVLTIWEDGVRSLLAALAALAETHADTAMAARTYGQIATPTSFGAVVAGWGWPLLPQLAALDELRPRVLRVSLSGAAGTLAAMGPRGPEVRARMANDLGLADPGHGWHADRSGIAALSGWIAGLAGTLGRIGEDLLLMTQSGIQTVSLAGGGASSTMPQKQNPVGPSVLSALARHAIGMTATIAASGIHRQQRDGAAWFLEWAGLAQACICAGRMLELATELVRNARPDSEAMRLELQSGFGVIHAEALTFALTEVEGISRPRAAEIVKELCTEAKEQQIDLLALADARLPGGPWGDHVRHGMTGSAPGEARAFARAVAALS